ncbi:MAG: DUF5666 domain-containing protein [Chloroflexota bacterium]|nr:MAG: hypothetical protein DIU68_15780 [Chloroflexota bacterium]
MLRSTRMLLRVVLLFLITMLAAGWQAVVAQDDGDTVELLGPIGAMTDTSITVNNQEIAIEPDVISEILGLGTPVIVDARRGDAETLDAEAVRIVDGRFLLPGELLITGVVDEIGATELTLNGISIDTTNLSAPDFEAGDRVWVLALANADGSLMARNVLALEEDIAAGLAAQTAGEDGELAANDLILIGTLQEVDAEAGIVIVAGYEIDVSALELEDDLLPGALVQVWLDEDGNTARRLAYADLFESAVAILDSDLQAATTETVEPDLEAGDAAG